MDYQPAVAQCAGIGRYTRLLAAELSALKEAEDELSLFFYDFKRKADYGTLSGSVRTFPDSVGTFPGSASSHGNPHGSVSLKPFRLLPGRVMETAMNWFGAPKFDTLAGAADVYHFTNFIAKKIRRGKSVASVHDMSFIRFPEFTDKKNLLYLKRGLKRTAAETALIITISEFSRREIEEILPETRGRVRVTPLGISEDFKPADAAEIAAVKRGLGLERPFVLTVGTIEPRKNLPFLADVFERVAPHGIDMVVAGAPGWKYEPILRRFAEVEEKYPGRFRCVRFVPDGKLAALYSAASLFAVASHYEGFGFPPLEAMACGTPVLSSDGGSLPEVLGDAAAIMRGFDADEWAAAALGIIASPPAPEAGIARAAMYKWSECARRTLGVYREACGFAGHNNFVL